MKRRRLIVLIALVGLPLVTPPVLADEGEKEFEGSVEFRYRNVHVNGSERKYDEDFDGLDSGARLSNLSLNWNDLGLTAIDYARIDVAGLGGDPYQRVGFRFGRSDRYDLTFNYRKQAYLYNLFELYGDEDGSTWNTERRMTNMKFTYRFTPRANVFLEYFDGQRSGNSFVMKDIERDLFRLETPVDVREKRYAVGTAVQVGPVDIYFRQTLRKYENDFDNITEGSFGLDQTDLTTLSAYEWRQTERSDADLTDIKIHADLGEHVDLTVGYYGTLLGDEEFTSRVDVNATGTSFSGTCAVGGGACSSDADCAGTDVCVANPFSIVDGFTDTVSTAETTLVDADLSWIIARPIILHLQYRSLDRELVSTGQLDTLGVGFPIAVDTRIDWQINTSTALVEIHPVSTLTIDVGYRLVDRTLDRDGFFLLARDDDFESDGDGTLVAGLTWKPVKWFRLDADYEDAEIEQPFTNMSLFEAERSRVRAIFTPLDKNMRIDLSYLDFENANTATDFRTGTNTFFGSSLDGTTWSASFWYRPVASVDFLLRYAEQEIDSIASLIYDTGGFGGTESGVSVFDDTNKEGLVQVNFSWADRWNAHARYMMVESDGNNPLIGDLTGRVNCSSPGAPVCNSAIGQDYDDAEVGLTYTFPSGIYFGGTFRSFDYDDVNDLVDYDGDIVTFIAGMNF